MAGSKGRREFIKTGGLLAASPLVLPSILSFTRGPLAFQDPKDDLQRIFGKSGDLTILNHRPWNVETPPHLLDDAVTPASRFFMRNNGLIPEKPDVAAWSLKFDGESIKEPIELSLEDIKSVFPEYTYQLVVECGGNGRAEFYPPASGNQWTTGAVACAEWTGVRLRDVLEHVGIKDDAVYVAYYGIDRHLSGDPEKVVISRGIPVSKAMEDDVLLAYKMNGEEIPIAHGYPLRLVVGGWPGSASGKWINRISIRNKVHDGPKMTGDSYRVPCEPVAPGSEVDPENMCIIEAMPVKSLITYPKTGAVLNGTMEMEIRGHAWVGDSEVSSVHYSIDHGVTWLQCELSGPVNRNAWQHFRSTVKFPKAGYFEVWAQAADKEGRSQPMVVPGWNPKGYLNNACHRIAVKVI